MFFQIQNDGDRKQRKNNYKYRRTFELKSPSSTTLKHLTTAQPFSPYASSNNFNAYIPSIPIQNDQQI